MSNDIRLDAIKSVQNRQNIPLEKVEGKISEFFACNVFGDQAMKTHMAPKVYKKIQQNIAKGKTLDRDLADYIAEAMRNWAMEKGATHYAHWFQPLTGHTAEKHDSFFTLDSSGAAIEKFNGDALVQQEPDGSSFPGGGLRSTFEARGYTAWDPTSPAFIFEVSGEKTLCVPTIFVTYGGQALDYKLPLLKSQSYLEEAAIEVCNLFDEQVNKVHATLGWEQEYFLLDEALYNARPDLIMCDRTLLGKYAPKGQQLDDHYFGSIPERVYAYMRDLENESHKLGIPVRTRHNEVAPCQYELAPIFEEVNVAVDHNQLLMDLMDRIARRHKLRVLLHEKPYAGVNGSGKHNNWSMATDTGVNLLSPGKDPAKNLQFLTFFVSTIKAVHQYADLLRASVTSASNDHRLGANEAPPAIISIFIGETLTRVLNEIEEGTPLNSTGVKEVMKLLGKIPNLEQDNTDRNRTSPFAFTGNKFEIRMAGSTVNCAAPMTVLNMIVGKQLRSFLQDVRIIELDGVSKDQAILTVIKRYITESKAIRFEGDNYSEAWKEEAARRGLNNFVDTPSALDAYLGEKACELFVESRVLSEREIHAHYEVRIENYTLKLQIESRTLAEMAMNQVLPAAVQYQNTLAENVLNLKNLGLGEDAYAAQLDLVQRIAKHINAIKDACYKMKKERDLANELDSRECAIAYCQNVKPLMEVVREHADELEPMIDDRLWALPKYRELLFLR
ncbi:MAG: glutamine synthetase III [Saprospiraceae bacterium]|nr:glutamine synthetase III [Saprospiraceae bacterium]